MYGWWRLNDGKGDVAVDCSGNGHHGMLRGEHGGPLWSKDARGTVLSFDGIDAYVETETFFPDLAMPLSISLWVKPAPTQTEHADILGNHGEPFVGINLQQEGTNTNCFGFGFGDGRKWQGTGSAPLKAGHGSTLPWSATAKRRSSTSTAWKRARAPARDRWPPIRARTSSWGRDTTAADTSTAC